MLEELEGELSLLYDCLPREEIEKVDSSKGEKVAKRSEAIHIHMFLSDRRI